MNSIAPPNVDFQQIALIFRARWRWWIIPTVGMTVLAAGYAFIKPKTWQARQALIVRDEAVGDISRQGRFDNTSALKTAQETVLEVARRRSVVEAALKEIGPARAPQPPNWPSNDEVRSLQDAIAVRAPKGVEFGQTEVIYLSVQSDDPRRAVALTQAVCHHLERHLQLLRRNKAQSLIDELTRTWTLATKDLDSATARLQSIETTVGSDLGELRILTDAGAGDSNLRSALNQVKSDLRLAKTNQKSIEKQIEFLEVARRDEGQWTATPTVLLDSQPALRRLKDGLVDAQLRSAALRGSMSADHPQVREAAAAEEEVRGHLQREQETALASLHADLQINRAQVKMYEEQLAEVTARLDRLANLRATYANLQSEVRQRITIVEKAQNDLSTARASQAAAASSSLLTRIDAPVLDDRPLGPGRATIVLAGMAGGLATGIGLLFLTAPTGRQLGRRWSDYLRHGRRASDQAEGRGQIGGQGRRADDVNYGRRAGDQTPPGRRADEASLNRRASDRTVSPTFSGPTEVASVDQPAVVVDLNERSRPPEFRDTDKESLTLSETLNRLVMRK